MVLAIFSQLPIVLTSEYFVLLCCFINVIFIESTAVKIFAFRNFFCSMKASDVPNLEVKLGDHNINSRSEAVTTNVRVANIIKHKGFSQRTLVSMLNSEFKTQSFHTISIAC